MRFCSPWRAAAAVGLLASSLPAIQSSTQEETPPTQVFVLGMLHDGHLESEDWDLAAVRETIRRIDPDVVCPEIPPDRWPAAEALWRTERRVEDERILQFPEYVEALMPLLDEMDFTVAPVAGWRAEIAAYRDMRIQAFATEDEFADAHRDYLAAQDWVAAWLAAHEVRATDEALHLHSPAYDRRMKGELGPYEHFLGDVIGRPAGWQYINQEHFVLIERAIRHHAGQRLLITFGAGHRYWFLEQLKNMPDVEVIDVRPFLPGRDGWRPSATQRAREAFDAGIDDIETWRALMRGDALMAWERIGGWLALEGAAQEDMLATLAEQKGRVASEFMGRMWYGRPFVRLHPADGRVELEVEVRYAMEDEPAGMIRATLVPDAARPHGYAWTRLELPEPRADG